MLEHGDSSMPNDSLAPPNPKKTLGYFSQAGHRIASPDTAHNFPVKEPAIPAVFWGGYDLFEKLDCNKPR
jgi:hypothetical protein